MGQPVPFVGAPAAEPMGILAPMKITLPAAGGSRRDSPANLTLARESIKTGTITITRRTRCGQKVKEVNTYPPGQQTSASSMVGKGFAAGEKITHYKVEFVFEDGSIVRLDKGGAIKQDANCESFTDKSRSFKGTLLLGKIWMHVTKVFGGQEVFENGSSYATGVRGTTFWMLPGKTSRAVGWWFQKAASGCLTPRVTNSPARR